MGSDPILTRIKFDRIIFNLPHTGHFPDLCESGMNKMHKELLSYFFKNTKGLLNEDGEVHITHMEDYPYDHWKVTKLAKKEGFHLFEKVEFQKSDYPGYHNKRGSDIMSN
ncbi:hypothetical protein GIB67_028640 [Kingdonia uniflora]|uniref:25S rRNA (uridine-N(3))-methyltransferase BMT5-like domain-containing protein n=1 Tax=Kingdonia uniflora TaxID=39325 RepID=A0A7J7KZS7_9MAGN|nr:hypothetical protein GIB67_028640 [Kingdonia uniflora]